MTSEPTLEETALHLMRFALGEAEMRREQVKRAEDAAEHWRTIAEREMKKREARLPVIEAEEKQNGEANYDVAQPRQLGMS